MRPRKRKSYLLLTTLFLLLAGGYTVHAWQSVPVVDDPLVRMPGTQPGQASLSGWI